MATNLTHNISQVGISVPVATAQELSSSNSKDIPKGYFRQELKLDEVSDDENLQIPVVDMSKLAVGNPAYQTEMAKLHQACKEWGFFQLTDHGATDAIEKMKVDSQAFFKLSLEEKMVYAHQEHGVQGYGKGIIMSEDQKLDWNDTLVVFSRPVSERAIKFWPINPMSFRSTLENYSQELHQICLCLYKAMTANLGVEFEEFADMYQEWTQAIKVNYYPPCSQADKILGFSPHSDASVLTLLVQANDVEGLQISKNGKWIPVKPVPGAIVVNIGDILEMMSNGEYRSIEHRAVVNFEKERISIAAFHNPSTKAIISPLMSDLTKENGARFKTVNYEEYFRLYLQHAYTDLNILDTLRI